ncbi:MAG: TetR/AcrR family transcriptional regulator [Bacteroidota bacterium]
MSTKRRILDAARSLMNEKGLKAVTAREICHALGISPGSFSYHFSDKTLIMRTLYEELRQEIQELYTGLDTEKVSIVSYLKLHEALFDIQTTYKFFYLNLFEIFTQYPKIRASYLAHMIAERQMARASILHYQSLGILKKDLSPSIIHRLVNVGQILNNFWTVDAEMMKGQLETHHRLHYLQICCGLMEPYLEPTSLESYKHYFKQLAVRLEIA